jgi:multidrug efflux pump subunit AcrA (membrane-fusion protein)
MTSSPSTWRRLPLLAGLICACLPLGCGKQEPAENAPPATVKWLEASENALEEWTELAGSTMPLPDRIARVSSAVDGKVRSVLTGADGQPIVEGQAVAKGTVLVQLDDTIIRFNLAKLEADQDVLREEEKQAEFAVTLATSELDRLRKLKEEDDKHPRGSGYTPLVFPADMQKADLAMRDATSKLQASRGRLISGAKGIDALKQQLKLYSLATPIAGRVGRVQVVVGQAIAANTPVAEVLDLENEIDVLCWVPADMVRRLKVGMPAKSGAFEKNNKSAEIEAEGTVAYLAEQADPDTGNFAVKIRLNNKSAHLRANRLIRVRIATQETRACLALPESAVMEDEEPPSVVIVEDIRIEKNADGKEETRGTARRLQVELGVRDRTLHQVEILRLTDPEGRWHGDIKQAQYVVQGMNGLQTGDPVKLEADDD